MKKGLIAFILLTIIAIIINYSLLEIKWFTFIGVYLMAVIFISTFITLVVKFITRKNPNKKEKNAFIFPNAVAKKMKNTDLGIQYESSILASAFLVIGTAAFAVYMIFFLDLSTVMKFFIAFNAICGMILMGSMLVTTYQQLISFRESSSFLTEFSNSQRQQQQPSVKPLPTQTKPKRRFFGLGKKVEEQENTQPRPQHRPQRRIQQYQAPQDVYQESILSSQKGYTQKKPQPQQPQQQQQQQQPQYPQEYPQEYSQEQYYPQTQQPQESYDSQGNYYVGGTEKYEGYEVVRPPQPKPKPRLKQQNQQQQQFKQDVRRSKYYEDPNNRRGRGN